MAGGHRACAARSVLDGSERGARLGALDHLIKSQTTPTKLSQRLTDWLKR